MKTQPLLLSLLLMMMAGNASAQQAGDAKQILGVDKDKSTVTVGDKSRFKTYSLAMTAEVSINGAKATVGELSVGMKISTLSLSDPSTIRKLEAFSAPVSAQTTVAGDKKSEAAITPISKAAKEELTNKLAGTFWTAGNFNKQPKDRAWFSLNADGTATAGWHKMAGSWEVVGKQAIQLKISGGEVQAGRSTLAQFDSQFTQLSGLPRIEPPSPAMLDKVARGFTAPSPAPRPKSSPKPASGSFFGTKATPPPPTALDQQ